MDEDPDRFVFPDLPDEAVVAIEQFIEAFYHRFETHYFAQLHRWSHALDQREHDDSMPSRPRPLPDPPF
jgi:hypothetical protein